MTTNDVQTMRLIRVDLSIQDAETLCRGAMSSVSLSAAQASQIVARVQQAIQAAAEAAAAKAMDDDTIKEKEPEQCETT